MTHMNSLLLAAAFAMVVRSLAANRLDRAYRVRALCAEIHGWAIGCSHPIPLIPRCGEAAS